MKKTRHIFSSIFLMFAIFVLIYVVYSVIQARRTGEELFIFGYKPYIILTGSMEPELKVNELVIIKNESYNKIKIGDIISFYAPNIDISVCHRVVDINDAGMYTKGDNNNREDLLTVNEDNFVGKLVFKTSAISFIISEARSPMGIVKIIIFIVAIILAIALIKYLIRLRYKAKEPEQLAEFNKELTLEQAQLTEPNEASTLIEEDISMSKEDINQESIENKDPEISVDGSIHEYLEDE